MRKNYLIFEPWSLHKEIHPHVSTEGIFYLDTHWTYHNTYLLHSATEFDQNFRS